jgi:hypothetical protein
MIVLYGKSLKNLPRQTGANLLSSARPLEELLQTLAALRQAREIEAERYLA